MNIPVMTGMVDGNLVVHTRSSREPRVAECGAEGVEGKVPDIGIFQRAVLA